ncbi:Preprotein translocase subunit YajC [Paramagnetospirillum magnetotacticum MS-1]|uniref:Sec translocon accessory complex subunit YajC n=1 Tax=Paramagnetospirillum magnetotacticum MS-1 TaxID=272627 RepID=A0A0C2YUX9_PARME|nr:preprotein translocase subunit YajC [Paramagnetospirillum magnetotacticum]KIL98928.1 Preprotein translocase subunit YajC [Paramagnetospirillum magnetotacticum MS-1]
MFVSPAYAQAAAAGAGGSFAALEQFLPLILIFVVFYFLLIRPQQKKMKLHKEMLGQLRRGDRVVTAGGIIGTVNKLINDTEVSVEIAEGVRVRVLRATITEVLSKTEPVAADKAKDEKSDAEPAADK